MSAYHIWKTVAGDHRSLIKQECGQHQKLTVNMPYISGTAMVNYATMPMTVEVGGATIFVINVDRYEKI